MSMKRAGGLVVLTFLGFLLPAWGVEAGSEADLLFSDLYRDSAGPVALFSPPRKPDGVARALEILLAGRTLPIPCASPILQDLRRHRELLGDSAREILRFMSLRPAIEQDGVRSTRDGRFSIHYTLDPLSSNALPAADRDFNGVPDVVDQVESALERSLEKISERLGYPAPSSDNRGQRYDVYLLNLGGGRQGFTVSDRDTPSTPREDSFSHMVLDTRMDADALASAVAHQVAHASLLGLSARAPSWWEEATAGWLEIQVTGNPSPHREALARRLEHLGSSLATDSLALSLGNSLWASFLADRRDGRGEEIRQIWLETSLRGGEPLLALMDEVLRRTDHGTLAEAFRDFSRWSLFTGPRDDGDHFRLGALFPPLTPRVTHTGFPSESAGTESVDPLGAAVFRFAGDGSRGGLKIRFDAETPAAVEVDLVIQPAGEPRPHLVELELDDRGHGEAGIPWRGIREAFLIVRNPGWEGAPVRFHYSGQIDPRYPFDLASFGALPSTGGITLQWATASEVDVLGWNVYRSTEPGGPFLRVNPLLLPTGSDSLEETDYLYLDSSVQSGRRYYYLVEAVTLMGLPERSLVLSTRASEGSHR